MAIQYAEGAYLVANHRFRNLNENNAVRAKAVAVWLRKVESEWPRLSVELAGERVSEIRLGEEVLVSAKVMLHSLSPDDVHVQVLTGPVDADNNLKDSIVIPMRLSERDADGSYLFQTVIQPSARSGMHGYAIRLLPRHADSVSSFLPGLSKWAQASSPVAELQFR